MASGRTTKTEMAKAINHLNSTIQDNAVDPKITLASVAQHLGGDEHPYKFSRSDPEFVILSNSSASSIANDAVKLGIRCWDKNQRQIAKDELASRVFAVHKDTMIDVEWFEPSFFGANCGEYWKPKLSSLLKTMLVILTMFILNYSRGHIAQRLNCHVPTFYNFGGIFDTPYCVGLKWIDALWSGIQQSFVFGFAASVAYSIPTFLGWRTEPHRFYAA